MRIVNYFLMKIILKKNVSTEIINEPTQDKCKYYTLAQD